MVGGWPEVDLGGSALRGCTSDLGKHMKGEVLWKEYLKEYFTGESASKGRRFGRSLAGVLQQEQVVDAVGGWARGRSLGKCIEGRHLRLGEAHERGSTLEGVLEGVLYWGKHFKGKVLQKEFGSGISTRAQQDE